MNNNPLLRLESLEQQVWLDFLSRAMIEKGELARMIEEVGLSGVTTNPTTFEKAIDLTHEYDQEIRHLISQNLGAHEIAGKLMLDDVRAAADQFRTLYERTDGLQGFVSIEVSPTLSHDTGGTIREARTLWNAVNRPNILVKVPATREGLPAIRELTGEAINVNVTLLFGLSRYREVVQAYLEGMAACLDKGGAAARVTSVASFFLSRIDVLIDPLLDKRFSDGGDIGRVAASLKGKVGIASAVKAYALYKETFKGAAFAALKARGARPQRVLWASMGTKNPDYSDILYVEPLIGPETIATLPKETIDAYLDHGSPAPRLDEQFESADDIFGKLPSIGIDLDSLAHQLETDGVQKFVGSYEKLIETLERKIKA